MITEAELVARIALLDLGTLHEWIDRGWVQPRRTRGEVLFDDADVARARFICELRRGLGLDDEALPVVVSLVDQLYELRRTVKALAGAIEAEPKTVRQRIARQLRARLRASD